MKVLVLATDYVRLDGYIQLMYVHIRNKYYVKNQIDVTAINFNCKENYIIDGVKVITIEEYKKYINKKYDVLIVHAPNIRNHYKFLKEFENNFKKILFIFHGHEVVKLTKVYPKPFKYNKGKFYIIKRVIQDIYDSVKLKIWNKYLPKILYKSHYIFVSKSMYNDFLKWTKINEDLIKGKYSIIYNSVSEIFEKQSYDRKVKKIYDYITIRNNLDSSVYCIDIIHKLAIRYPNKKFLIIGSGSYFEHNKCPNNITLIKNYLQHNQMLEYINQALCALMPTRRDTQGVMSCELATYGIPLITSNIPVCKEVFEGFENVALIDNELIEFKLDNITKALLKKNVFKKNSKYYQINTCNEEIKLINSILKKI